jgi:sulfide:quinone oxidoreductase
VIATGVTPRPDQTPGMLDGGHWRKEIFDFYTYDGALALAKALDRFEGGRLVVHITDLPIKCPVAPLEFAFLADWYLRERGIRGRTELIYATPLDGAFTKPVASSHLSGLLAEKGIALETEFATGEVDGENGRLISYDEREVPFDLLVTIPLHGGQAYVGRSAGLGDELGFVATDPHTLQAKTAANVFAIGDATNLPTSKAGSVTHFEGDTLVANIVHFLAGEPLEASFDGHSNCFIETGFRKALLIDFNYDIEPLPGRFPEPHVGPLPLLKESRLNHMAKLAFQWVYWHMLLPGHPLPGISTQLQLAGKDLSLLPTTQGAPR